MSVNYQERNSDTNASCSVFVRKSIPVNLPQNLNSVCEFQGKHGFAVLLIHVFLLRFRQGIMLSSEGNHCPSYLQAIFSLLIRLIKWTSGRNLVLLMKEKTVMPDFLYGSNETGARKLCGYSIFLTVFVPFAGVTHAEFVKGVSHEILSQCRANSTVWAHSGLRLG